MGYISPFGSNSNSSSSIPRAGGYVSPYAANGKPTPSVFDNLTQNLNAQAQNKITQPVKITSPQNDIQGLWNKFTSYFDPTSNNGNNFWSNSIVQKAVSGLEQGGIQSIDTTIKSPVPQAQTPKVIKDYNANPIAQMKNNKAATVANFAGGVLNAYMSPAIAGVQMRQQMDTGQNTPKNFAGDLGTLAQFPLVFLGGAEGKGLLTGAKTVAGGLTKTAIVNLTKSLGKNALIGGGFGLTSGLQSGEQITNLKDYITNLFKNTAIGTAFGIGVDIGIRGTTAIASHIVLPLAKGATAKAGALFIKDANTNNPQIVHMQLDPKVAQSTVMSNDKVAHSPVGKAVMKESINAQKQNAQVGVTVNPDGKYTLPNGQKADVTTVPVYDPQAQEAFNNSIDVNQIKTANEQIKLLPSTTETTQLQEIGSRAGSGQAVIEQASSRLLGDIFEAKDIKELSKNVNQAALLFPKTFDELKSAIDSGRINDNNYGTIKDTYSQSRVQAAKNLDKGITSGKTVEDVAAENRQSENVDNTQGRGSNSQSSLSEQNTSSEQRSVGSGTSTSSETNSKPNSTSEPQLNNTSSKQPLEPVGGSGKQVETKHASYIEAQAILKKITDKPFEKLNTHEAAVWKQQEDMAKNLYDTNPDLAMKVAMGEANAPEGYLAPPIRNYVVSKTTDLETLIKLGNSPYNDELTAIAQNLSSAKLNKDPDNPNLRTADTIKQVNKAIDTANKGKIDAKNSKAKQIITNNKDKILLSKEDLKWSKFIDSIKCDK